MTKDEKEIEDLFKLFVEGTLVEHNIQKSLSVISDDVTGIGMGNQGAFQGKKTLSGFWVMEKRTRRELSRRFPMKICRSGAMRAGLELSAES